MTRLSWSVYLLIIALALVWAGPARAQLDSLASWEGEQAGEQFGIALSIGGDANGDGLADLAVGSNTNDEGGDNAGKVSVFFGRSSPSGGPDLEILGPPGSFFGAAVAWAGDVNNDSFDDLLVGAYRDTTNGTTAGTAFLFLGGDPMDDVPDLVMTIVQPGVQFGRAVAGIGDLNGDEYSDFAVGAPRTPNGSVFIFFGGNPPDSIVDLIVDGTDPGDRFGSAVCGPGNVDGLAGDDFLVGAPRASAFQTWQGAAYLFSGGPGLDGVADWAIHGEGSGDQLGTAVAAAGDVNGDGEPDLVVGSPYWNDGSMVDVGAAYVFYGGDLLDTISDFSILGSIMEENLGRSVAGCGDITGSGFSHVLVGAPGGWKGGIPVGRAVVSPGGNPPETEDIFSLYGEAPDDQFGYAVAGAAGLGEKSFSGDSGPDLAIGAWSHGDGGHAYVYGIIGLTAVAEHGWHPPRPLRSSVMVSPNPGTEFTLTFVMDDPEPKSEYSSRPTRIRIFDATGRVVRVLPCPVHLGDRAVRVKWDGLSWKGERVASGVYYCVVEGSSGRLGTGRVTVLR
jgi:hypothetical protein